MPHYFFDVDDGDTVMRDAVGITLPGREQARVEALRSLPELAADLLLDGSLDGAARAFTVRVREDNERAVLEAKLLFVAKWLE